MYILGTPFCNSLVNATLYIVKSFPHIHYRCKYFRSISTEINNCFDYHPGAPVCRTIGLVTKLFIIKRKFIAVNDYNDPIKHF